jgi:hypothetical protein
MPVRTLTLVGLTEEEKRVRVPTPEALAARHLHVPSLSPEALCAA